MTDLLFIRSNSELNEYCQTLRACSVIALDTEFQRVRTYYPKAALFQVNDGDNIALIDPLEIDDWQAFNDVLADEGIIKVMHACDEDVELFHHCLGVKVDPVFDTQVAAALCGFDFSMGYQRLVQELFDVELEKTSSRSDWLQRPLTTVQLHYAANDVRYLIDTYDLLVEKLVRSDLLHAVYEEYERVFANVTNTDFSGAHVRVKQAWKLNAAQFAVLKKLACWRETVMREKDLPRKKVASDDALMALASGSGWHKQKMFSVDGLPPATIKAEAETILRLMEEASEEAASEVARKPAKGDKLLNSLKALLKNAAQEAGIAEQMLSQKSWNLLLQQQFKRGDFSLPEQVCGWRQVYYQQAVAMLEQRQGGSQ